MNESSRSALHAYVSHTAHERWHDVAAEFGISVSALLEVVGLSLSSESPQLATGAPFEMPLLVNEARRIDAERRRRRTRRIAS